MFVWKSRFAFGDIALIALVLDAKSFTVKISISVVIGVGRRYEPYLTEAGRNLIQRSNYGLAPSVSKHLAPD